MGLPRRTQQPYYLVLMRRLWRSWATIALGLVVIASNAQVIDTVLLTEVGRYRHPYVSFPDSFSAPTFSSRLDRLGRPYLYMACNDSGLITLDITDPTLPIVVDRKYPAVLSGLNVSNLEQVDDLLYLALGGFSSGTQSAGLAVLDLTNASSPAVLGQWNGGATYAQGSAIVKVDDGHAYLGAMEDGIIVLDVSDPANIQFMSSYQPDPTWPGIAGYPPNGRGMAIVGDVLYLAFDAGALRSIDISDPSSLTEIGHYLNPSHPILTNPAYNNVVVIGDRAYCTIDYCGLEVVDISDPANMAQTAWLNPWNCIGLSWFGSDGHTNELITALGDSLLFVSGADSEILVYDVTDPDMPLLKGGHILPNDSASTWGVDVFGDLVVGNFINNHGIPFQPYDSKYGGVVMFNWQAEFVTGAHEAASARPSIMTAPNPTSGPLTIQLPSQSRGTTTISVMDPLGRTIIRSRSDLTTARDGRAVLDLTPFAPGPYFVTIEEGGRRSTERVVLVRD